VTGEQECLLFLSANQTQVRRNYKDRAFAANTTDGGKTFQFLVGWGRLCGCALRDALDRAPAGQKADHDRETPNRSFWQI